MSGALPGRVMWADVTGGGDGRGDSTGAADTQPVSGLWQRSPRTPVPVPLQLPGGNVSRALGRPNTVVSRSCPDLF